MHPYTHFPAPLTVMAGYKAKGLPFNHDYDLQRKGITTRDVRNTCSVLGLRACFGSHFNAAVQILIINKLYK